MNRARVWLGAPTREQVVHTPAVPGPATARRAHRASLGAGWFSHADIAGQGGRFDLRLPGRGTMYCANDDEAAVREHLGERYGGRRYIAASDIEHLSVSDVDIHQAGLARALADTLRARTVTREISTMSDYAITQAWADAYAQHDFDGIRYEPRSTPGPEIEAYAVFGPEGSAQLSTRPVPDWRRRLAQRGVGIGTLSADAQILP